MSVELNSVIGMEASEVGPGITKANERQVRWYSTRAQAVSAAGAETWTVGSQIAVGPCIWEYDGTSTVISDMTGWVPVSPVNTRHWGVAAGTDSTAALQEAVSSGLPLVHDVYCTASARLECTGPLILIGSGKGRCGISWTQGGDTEGIRVTRSSWLDSVHIDGIDLTPSSAGTSTGIVIDNDNISGTTAGRSYFNTYTRVTNCRLGAGLGVSYGWKIGIECRFPFATEISDNEIYGYASPGALIQSDFVTRSVGISVPDQAVRTLTNFQMYRNTIMGFETGAYIYNVEGSNAEQNDFQVNYDGLVYHNTITKVNQYRVRWNHLGVLGCQFRAINARQILFEANEVSYRKGRTDGGTVSLIELDSVYSVNIIGNSIRGNVSDDTDIVVDGITYLWNHSTSSADYTRQIIVSGNSFQNLHNAETNSSGVNAKYISRVGNTYDGIRNKRLNVGSANATLTSPMYLGSGDFESPSYAATNTAVVIKNIAASCLGLERQDSDGAVVVFNRSGSIVGSISTTSSGTAYNQTSDSRLKTPVSIMTAEDALEIIKKIIVRKFTWNSTGESDTGAFAQELYEVWPIAVTPGVGDPGDPDFIPWSVDYSKIVPLLIAAMK